MDQPPLEANDGPIGRYLCDIRLKNIKLSIYLEEVCQRYDSLYFIVYFIVKLISLIFNSKHGIGGIQKKYLHNLDLKLYIWITTYFWIQNRI